MRSAYWVLGVLTALAVVSCTKEENTDSGGPTASAPAVRWVTNTAEVTGVRAVDDHTATVEALLPAGGAGCARDLRVEYLIEQDAGNPDVIYANVVYDSAFGTVEPCQGRTTGEVAMRVTQPLGDRTLMFNSTSPPWEPAGARYVPCEGVLGCDPPADSCDPAWIATVGDERVEPGLDHARHELVTCDGRWLVMNVIPPAAACSPACATTHEFYQFDGRAWGFVVSTEDGGCGEIHARRPQFPVYLCESLA